MCVGCALRTKIKEKPMHSTEQQIQIITTTLKNEGIITFPTDTVWGMGCLVESQQAVRKIYETKKREGNKPLILLSSKLEYLLPYVENLPPLAEKLIEKYWPGPLTIVVKKSSLTPDYITSGLDTVGIRVPDSEEFWEIVNNCVENHVLATTSNNISGQKPMGGKESTVVAVDESNNLKMLRKGAIEQIVI